MGPLSSSFLMHIQSSEWGIWAWKSRGPSQMGTGRRKQKAQEKSGKHFTSCILIYSSIRPFGVSLDILYYTLSFFLHRFFFTLYDSDCFFYQAYPCSQRASLYFPLLFASVRRPSALVISQDMLDLLYSFCPREAVYICFLPIPIPIPCFYILSFCFTCLTLFSSSSHSSFIRYCSRLPVSANGSI